MFMFEKSEQPIYSCAISFIVNPTVAHGLFLTVTLWLPHQKVVRV